MKQTYRSLRWIGKTISGLLVILYLVLLVNISVAAETKDKAQIGKSTPFKLVPQTTIRVSVVEWLAAEGEYKEWTALGGEYTIDTDGTISMPLVGNVYALGYTANEISQSISVVLQTNTGLTLAPSVSVQIVEYPPVYVTGDVERTGEIPYRPGLTVMQAVALAGGQEKGPDPTDRYNKLDQIRYSGELNRIELQIAQQLARRARLQAELAEKSEFTFPPEFEALLDESIKSQIRTTETILFQSRKEALQRQVASLEDLRELLTDEASVLEEQMAVQDRQIEVALEELSSISKLFDSGVVTKSRQTSLGRLVADLQRTKMNLIIASMRAQQSKGETSRDIVALRAQRQTEISRELQISVGALEELTMRRSTARQLLQATGFISLENEQLASLAELPLNFSIVRASQTRRITNISPAELLFPGDLLEVGLSIEVPLNSVASSTNLESN